MNKKRKIYVINAALVVFCLLSSVFCLLLIAIISLVYISDPFNFTAPSDQKLINIFQVKRQQFEKLHEMAMQDGQSVSYISSSGVHGSISEARKQEYSSLLSTIYPGLIMTMDGGSERYIFAHGGLSAISGGWLKGIEFISGEYSHHGKLIQNVDEAKKLPPDVYLRKIGVDNWFVVYQRTID